MDTLISNVTVVTMNEKQDVLFGAYIGIREGKIAYIGKSAPDCTPKTILDGTGMVAMPGLVNCHTHLATAALRNYLDDTGRAETLEQLLARQDKLDNRAAKASALLAIAECLRFGVTSVSDLYYFPEATAQAVAEAGIKANLALSAYRFVDENEDFDFETDEQCRETVRVAMDQLVQEGLIYRVKGSGTYFYMDQAISRELSNENARWKIGLILQGQDPDANAVLIEGIRSVLPDQQVDLHIFLTDNKFSNERRCLQTVVHQNFQGFIVDGVKASIMSPNLDCYQELYRRRIPVVFYNNYYKNLRYPSVIVNDMECAEKLVGRLIQAGHKPIAGIFVYDNYQSVEKFQGMAEAMRRI